MKNQFFERDNLIPVPWKNGGGITREIAASEAGAPFWRLSIADVTKNGEFSVFPGLHRILTVVEGDGMVLQGQNETYRASPLNPVSFPGDILLLGKLIEGPVQNFNLIYDATKLDAEVTVLRAQHEARQGSAGSVFEAVYCVTGSVQVKGTFLQPFQGCYGRQKPDVQSDPGAISLRVRLFDRKN